MTTTMDPTLLDQELAALFEDPPPPSSSSPSSLPSSSSSPPNKKKEKKEGSCWERIEPPAMTELDDMLEDLVGPVGREGRTKSNIVTQSVNETEVVIISTLKDCKKAINHLKTTHERLCRRRGGGVGRGEDVFVALDCEASRGMDRFGKLCLVQVSIGDGVCFLFDTVDEKTAKDLFGKGGLRDFLQDPKFIFATHDCRGDCDILFHSHKVRLVNVIDTQVTYALYTHQTKMFYPLPIGLNRLLKKFAQGNTNKMKDEAREAMINDDRYWERRPLSEVMAQYASEDVLYLSLTLRQMWSVLHPFLQKETKKVSMEYTRQFTDLPDEAVRKRREEGAERDRKRREKEEEEKKGGKREREEGEEKEPVKRRKVEGGVEGEVEKREEKEEKEKEEKEKEGKEKEGKEKEGKEKEGKEKEGKEGGEKEEKKGKTEQKRFVPTYGVELWDKAITISLNNRRNRR